MRAARVAFVAIAIAAWTVGCAAERGGLAQSRAPLGALRPDTPRQAPDFSLPGLDGGERTLASLRGQVVLVHFWATWCRPCRTELPTLQHLWELRRHRGLALVAIADRDDPEQVRAMLRELRLDFPVALDPKGGVANTYAVAGLPSTFVVDREGGFVAQVVGTRDWTHPAAVAWIERLLDEPASTRVSGVSGVTRPAWR